MNGFSTTQAANLTVIAGAVFIVLKMFKPDLEVTQDQIAVLLGAFAIAGAAIISFINRHKKGDLTVAGFRK